METDFKRMLNYCRASKHLLNIFAGSFAGFILGVALPTQAHQNKTPVAVYHQVETNFSETITLYSNGKYQQSETQHYAVPSVSSPFPRPHHSELQRGGAWRLLDKEGGSPVVLSAEVRLPKEGVIELKGTMPFGVTWERQQPRFLHSDRTLPATAFQMLPILAQKK